MDWAVLMRDEVDRVRKNMTKGQKAATTISTYAGHLYATKGVLGPEEQDEFDKLLKIQSYGAVEIVPEESDKESEESEEEDTPLIHRRKRKRRNSPVRVREPEPSTPRADRSTQAPAEVSPAHVPFPSPGPELPRAHVSTPSITDPIYPSGRILDDIEIFCNHVQWRARLLEDETREKTAALLAVMEEVGLEEPIELLARLKELRAEGERCRVMEAKLQIAQTKSAAVAKSNTNLWDRIEKMEEELRVAWNDSESAKEKARSSGRALAEVKAAVDFPVDTANRARLYDRSLEGMDTKNLSKIIRFLMDHSKEMDKTWSKMRTLVTNMTTAAPTSCGTQLPEQLLPSRTAARPSGSEAGPSGSAVAPAVATAGPRGGASTRAADPPASIPGFPRKKINSPSSPAKWGSFLSAQIPRAPQEPIRLASESPEVVLRTVTEAIRLENEGDVCPSLSLEDLVVRTPQSPAATSSPATTPEPTPPSGPRSQRTSVTPPPQQDPDRTSEELTPRRRSLRSQSQATP